jgi:hypothetical protein
MQFRDPLDEKISMNAESLPIVFLYLQDLAQFQMHLGGEFGKPQTGEIKQMQNCIFLLSTYVF